MIKKCPAGKPKKILLYWQRFAAELRIFSKKKYIFLLEFLFLDKTDTLKTRNGLYYSKYSSFDSKAENRLLGVKC